MTSESTKALPSSSTSITPKIFTGHTDADFTLWVDQDYRPALASAGIRQVYDHPDPNFTGQVERARRLVPQFPPDGVAAIAGAAVIPAHYESDSEMNHRIKNETDYLVKHDKAVSILYEAVKHRTEFVRSQLYAHATITDMVDFLHGVFRATAGHTADTDWLSKFNALELTSHTLGALRKYVQGLDDVLTTAKDIWRAMVPFPDHILGAGVAWQMTLGTRVAATFGTAIAVANVQAPQHRQPLSENDILGWYTTAVYAYQDSLLLAMVQVKLMKELPDENSFGIFKHEYGPQGTAADKSLASIQRALHRILQQVTDMVQGNARASILMGGGSA
ncbi:hypothetical protein HK101_006688, partial [Irineochytrium annulatum]